MVSATLSEVAFLFVFVLWKVDPRGPKVSFLGYVSEYHFSLCRQFIVAMRILTPNWLTSAVIRRSPLGRELALPVVRTFGI